MSNKTITVRVRRAQAQSKKIALLTDWIDNWQQEQIAITRTLERGIDCVDIDYLYNSAAGMRAITDKKFDALYNCLAVITNDEYFPPEEHWIYQWGKRQVGIVAAIGREASVEDYDELDRLCRKLQGINGREFDMLKSFIVNFGVEI